MHMSNHDSTITIYGADWCADCRLAKAFFEKHKIGFEYINVEEEPEKVDEAEKLSGRKSIPVVVFPDNTFLVEPTEDELDTVCKRLKLL
jgi:mycoredoxin